MLILLLLPQGEKKNRTVCFPHPQKPCLQSCHPVTDRLSGVAARRGRRFGVWDDVHHPLEGSAETGLPPATRGQAAGLSDRSCRFHPNRASDVPVRHARRRASIARRLRGFPRFAQCRWRPSACPQSPPSQRDRSRKAQTAERGAGRCHTKLLQTRHHRRPVRPAHDAPTGEARSGWQSWKQVL